MTFAVLFICTANMCRSPMAEHLARQRLTTTGSALGWSVASAGVRAVEGLPIHPHAHLALQARGIDSSLFRSRRLEASDVDQADLILTAESVHRPAVTELVPRSAARTFTLLQFAALCEGSEPIDSDRADAGHALLDAALVHRGQRVRTGDDDIRDPIGRRRRAFRTCADHIDDALGRIFSPLNTQSAARAERESPFTPR